MDRLLGFAVVLATSVMAVSSEAATMFSGLGTLAGGCCSYALGVSADGLVVVGISATGPVGSPSEEAFRWTASAGMVQLPTLPGSTRTVASAVSDDGAVVVGHRNYPIGPNVEVREAVHWMASGEVSSLGFRGAANGVSSDGSVIAGYWNADDGTPQAFRWTSDGGVMGLGFLPGGEGSIAFDVSADGTTIVGSATTSESQEAFRWTSDTGMVSLVTLPGLGESEARAVSLDGSVVVGSAAISESGARQAFRWTSGEGIVLLGVPSGLVDGETLAAAVSADGSVIVGSALQALGAGQAFIWDPVHGMRLLRDVLVGDYGIDLMGWTLHDAFGISADGRTIVGTGTNPSGQIEAWIAVIPEPGTGLLVITGLLGLAARRKRRV